MESLSDNWLQWMEMIWSVLKQTRFALRGFAVKFSIWLGLGLVELPVYCFNICLHVFHYSISTLESICTEEQQHDL